MVYLRINDDDKLTTTVGITDQKLITNGVRFFTSTGFATLSYHPDLLLNKRQMSLSAEAPVCHQ